MKAEDDLVTVATFANALEAGVARGTLEASGIPAFVPDDAFGTFAVIASRPQQAWVELKVRPGDRLRALDVLHPTVRPHEVDVR